jgi:O-antigen/teichoic acid export membrane protein
MGGTASSRDRQIAASGLYLIPALAGNLIPLVTLPIFTRILTPDDYGAWALALAYASFLTGIANFGLTLSYDRNFFEYRQGRRAAALLYSVLGFVVVACCAGGVVTWIWQREIAAWLIGTRDAGPLVFWVFAATGLSGLKWYYLAYLRNHGDAKAYVWYTMDETVLATATSLFLVAYLRVGIIGLPWGQFAAASLVFALLTVRFVRTLKPAFSAALLGESLKLGYPLTPRIFLGVLGSHFDKYLLRLLASVGSAGVYTIGQKVSYVVFAYMTALENVFAPEVYRRIFDGGGGGGRSVGRYLTPFVYLSFAVAVAVSLFSEEALILLTPGSYHAAIPVVNLLTLYYAVMFFGKQPQLVYAKKTYLLSVLTVVSLTASVTFNFLGIRAFGTIGAALGTLFAGLFGVALYNVVARRYYRIEWEHGKLALMAGVLVASSAVPPLMTQVGFPYALRLAVKLLVLAAYAAVGARLGILTRENLQAAWSIAMRKFRPAPLAAAMPSAPAVAIAPQNGDGRQP